MIIMVPWPKPDLSPNKRIHWSALARAKQAYRQSCFVLAREEMGRSVIKATEELPVSITFCPPDNRKRDRDNMIAAFKSGQDGIADAIGIDDSKWQPSYHVGAVVAQGQVVVQLWPGLELRGEVA